MTFNASWNPPPKGIAAAACGHADGLRGAFGPGSRTTVGLNRHEQRQFDQLMVDLSHDPVFVARMSTRSPARLQRIRRDRVIGAACCFTAMTVLVAGGVLGAGIGPALIVVFLALGTSVLGIGATVRNPVPMRARCHLASELLWP